MYGQGISREGSLIDMAVDLGIVKKSGAWFTYEGEQLGQGREKAKEFLRSNPEVTVEVGTERFAATASELVGAERDRIWEAQKADYAQFSEYEETAAGRVIPVIAITRKEG